MYPEHTSASPGMPSRLWWSPETVHAWYALYEARVRRWHGVSWREPWGMLGGQAVVPPDARRPPYWVHNRPMHQLYLSTGHLSSATAPDYLRALRAHGASHVIAYPSAAAILAAAARET